MDYPSTFLDELRALTPLPAVIGRLVRLTRSGRQWKGCCPFHGEKTPSFYVYDDHYHCFGCGEHGDAVTFIMKITEVDQVAAVTQLASEVGLEVPKLRGGDETVTEAVRLDASAQNDPLFKGDQFEKVLGTAAKLLVHQKEVRAASILANAKTSVCHWGHDNWNGGQDTWRMYLAVAPDAYLGLADREHDEKTIGTAIATALHVVSERDFVEVEITTDLEHDPDWRQKIRQTSSGDGITNQGRVHSQNIATREYDHLLFRSKPEVYFYRALKAAGVAFAPLSVVIGRDGVGQKPRRIEPDFVIFKDGMVTVVEIDGDLYHTETPQAAHQRLKFLLDEGARLERLNASECANDDKAREAVGRVLMDIEKWRRSRA